MKKRKIFAGLLTFGLLSSMLFSVPASASADTAANAAQQQTENVLPQWPQGPEITSAGAVIMENSTKTVVYSKNPDEPYDPSSAVKVMTALIALENSQLTDQVTFTDTGLASISPGSLNIQAKSGEILTMEQCLYAMLLTSANDAAAQVAEQVGGGSIDAFVQMMNQKAQALGCANTVFTNPTGLSDPNQHTTPRDLALIMQAAMANETFRTISSAASYSIPATNVTGTSRSLTNNYPLLAASYQGSLGGRYAAGAVLAGAASRNNTTYTMVIMQGNAASMASEGTALMDHAFTNFQLVKASDDFSTVSGGYVCVPVNTDISTLTAQDTETAEGQISRTYYYNDIPVGSSVLEKSQETQDTSSNVTNLKEAKAVSESKSNTPYYIILGTGILLLVGLGFLLVKTAKS